MKETGGWTSVPIKALFRRRDERDSPDLPLLSVYRELGVVPRADREDNYNRPGDDLSSYRVVYPGDLVLNKMKTWQGSLGVSTYHGIVSPAYFVCEQIGPAEPRFLHHLLRSPPLVAEYAARSKGIRPSQWDLPWDEFRDIRVKLPSQEIQSVIADLLDRETKRIDTLIDAKRRMIALVAERHHSDVSALLGAPDRFVPLRRFASIQTGLTVDASRAGGDDSVTRPYLRVANVQPGHLALDEITEITVPTGLATRATLRQGDVLMTEGGDLDKLGRGTVWRNEIPNCLHQNHVFAVRPRAEMLDADYLALVTETAQARAYFESTGVKTTNLASTNTSKVLDLPIPVISLERQRVLVRRVMDARRGIAALMSALERQNALLVEHRQALITAAVTGELEVAGAA